MRNTLALLLIKLARKLTTWGDVDDQLSVAEYTMKRIKRWN